MVGSKAITWPWWGAGKEELECCTEWGGGVRGCGSYLGTEWAGRRGQAGGWGDRVGWRG